MKSRSNRWNRLIVAVLGLAVGASVASAQIVVENFANFQDVQAITNTLSGFTVSGGEDRKLVVAASWEGAAITIGSMTYGGQVLTQAVSSTAGRVSEIWYLDDPALGTADLVTVFSQSRKARIGVLSLQHAVPGPPGVSNTGSASLTIDLTTTAANTFVLGIYTRNGSVGTGIPSSFANSLYNGDSGSSVGSAGYQNEEVSGFKTYTWTTTDDGSAQAVAGFESFAYTPPTEPWKSPYADTYQTLGLWNMSSVRAEKYIDDVDTLNPGRDADWTLTPNTTNEANMVNVEDPGVYPADNPSFGLAAYFDGTDEEGAVLPYGSILAFDNNNARMEGWAKNDGTPTGNTFIFDRWGHVNFYQTATGYWIQIWNNGGAENHYAAPAGFNATNWNHWALDFTSNAVSVTVNGNLETTIPIISYGSPTRTTMYWGKKYKTSGQAPFVGWMDDVRITETGPFGDLVTYSDWANSHSLTGSETNLTADLEYGGLGDGADNLTEWALGGNPRVDDAADLTQNETDESLFSLSYNRRYRSDELGLEYIVETTDDLVNGTWTTNGVSEAFSLLDLEFEAATSSVSNDVAKRFLALSIVGSPQPITPPPVDLCAYEVPLAATTPTIDGVLTGTEYDDAHVIHLEYPSVTNCGSVKYQEASSPDFAVDYYLKWDATYLYVCVVVVDELMVFSENHIQAYPNDHMNIAIDPWRAGSGVGDIAFYEMYRSESVVSNNTAIQYRAIGINDPALAPDNAVIDSSVQAGVGYTIEAAFAWADLGIPVPAVGNKHRFLMFPADKDVATPDFGGINEGNTGTFFFDGQGAGGSEADPGVPTSYVNITLGGEL